jgi:small subunit ribosomal protein S21
VKLRERDEAVVRPTENWKPYPCLLTRRELQELIGRLNNINNRVRRKTMQVLVRDNNVDQALRVLKKKMQREGLFREMKDRRAYEKPSERRVREKAQAISRHRKAARKKLQREGLIAAPKRKISVR